MDAIAHVEDELDIVIDKQNADTAVAHKSDVVGELADLTLIEPGGRLVEKNVGRVGRQSACNAYSSLDAMGQRGRGSVRPLTEMEFLNQAIGSLTGGLGLLPGADCGYSDVLAHG